MQIIIEDVDSAKKSYSEWLKKREDVTGVKVDISNNVLFLSIANL